MSTLILRSGEPRPWIGKFIAATFPNIAYDPVRILFRCHLDEATQLFTRKFTFEGELRKPKTPFVLLAVTVHAKHGCAAANRARKDGKSGACPDQSQHILWMLWDTRTHTMTRIEPLRYHLQGFDIFKPHAVIKSLKQALPEWIGAQLQKHSLTPPKTIPITSHSYPAPLVQKVKTWVRDQLARDEALIWYPLLVLWDLDTLSKHPDFTREQHIAHMKKTPLTSLGPRLAAWQSAFEAYYVKNVRGAETCRPPKPLHNPETARCVREDGALGAILQPRAAAATHTKKARADYKFLAPSLVATADARDVTFLDTFFQRPALVTYLGRKYAHVAISDERIFWRKEKDVPHVLRFTPGFHAFWTQALADAKVQQIVTFLVLESHEFPESHANVLIYTKATKELEIFEPIGDGAGKLFDAEEMYDKIGAIMTEKYGHAKVLTPKHYCPKKMAVFQALEGTETAMWETDGYCAVWTVWYAEMRMSNPTLTTKACVALAMRRLVDMGSLRAFIWNYDRWVRRDFSRKG